MSRPRCLRAGGGRARGGDWQPGHLTICQSQVIYTLLVLAVDRLLCGEVTKRLAAHPGLLLSVVFYKTTLCSLFIEVEEQSVVFYSIRYFPTVIFVNFNPNFNFCFVIF